MEKNSVSHIPVLCEEVLSLCQNRKVGYVFDGTLGFGGHAKKILSSHPEIERYLGLDQDISALKSAQEALFSYRSKLEVEHRNFVEPIFSSDEQKFDLILLDIGVSSMQLDTPERGFSFMRDGPLDMRMNHTDHNGLTAEEIINQSSEKALYHIFFTYGEEPKSKLYAKAICERRRKQKFYSTVELASFIESISPRRGKIHPATLLFQALRIAVNNEIEVLEKALRLYPFRLNPGGIFMVITFHSLEDRVVKQSFRNYASEAEKRESQFRVVTKKPIQASFQEVRLNPRARSAKLRGLECIY